MLPGIVMHHSSSAPGARLLSPWWAAALLCLCAVGCVSEIVVDTPAVDGADPAEQVADPACAGTDPQTFCDDCNPCTEKANCTPCSTLPPAEQDIYHCTADEELPGFCVGRTGCVHVPLTTPPGQSASCFPVAGAETLHPGVCRAGTCADDAG